GWEVPDGDAGARAGPARHRLPGAGSIGLPRTHRRREHPHDSAGEWGDEGGAAGDIGATPSRVRPAPRPEATRGDTVRRRTAPRRNRARPGDESLLYAARRAVYGRRPPVGGRIA